MPLVPASSPVPVRLPYLSSVLLPGLSLEPEKGEKKKAALVMAARKEAGEGNVSRKATPKFGCPGLHQDTQSVEIEKLGIGEVISNLRASFVCF